MQKTIAILTSGGDAPGMNAVIREVARNALMAGMRVLGVIRGFAGLVNGDVVEMSQETIFDIIHLGGTILYTSRMPEFKQNSTVQTAANFCKKIKNIDAVVVIGGNGSLSGTKALSECGINCFFIPATIDNDINISDYSIGFDTALNTATEMIDKIRDTTQSHEKCSVVEVMGRKCGNLAQYIGIAVGATAIVVPEVPFDFEKDIAQKIKLAQMLGKRNFIIIVAEGASSAEKLSQQIEKNMGIPTRSTVLGYVQRGGSPTVRDRVFAAEMGRHTVNLIISGVKNRAIVVKNDKVLDIGLQEI